MLDNGATSRTVQAWALTLPDLGEASLLRFPRCPRIIDLSSGAQQDSIDAVLCNLGHRGDGSLCVGYCC